jgi:hypothetical protein
LPRVLGVKAEVTLNFYWLEGSAGEIPCIDEKKSRGKIPGSQLKLDKLLESFDGES